VPLVPMKEMLDRALADRYGVAAFNILDDVTIGAVLAAAVEEQAPVNPADLRQDGPPVRPRQVVTRCSASSRHWPATSWCR
jgi:hypothetical protein